MRTSKNTILITRMTTLISSDSHKNQGWTNGQCELQMFIDHKKRTIERESKRMVIHRKNFVSLNTLGTFVKF